MRSLSFFLLSLAAAVFARGEGLHLKVTAHDGSETELIDAHFSSDWRLTGKHEGASVDFDLQDLVSIVFSDKSPPSTPKGPFLAFPTGERFVSDVQATDGENLQTRSSLTGEVSVPLATVRGFVITPDSQGALADLSRRAKEEHADQVLLRNQDVVSGIVQSVEATKVMLLKEDEEMPIVRELVSAVAFDPSLTDYPLTNDFFGQARLTDGSVVNVHAMVSDGTKLRLKTSFGGEIVIEAKEVVDVSFRNGRVIYLSDLEPASVESEAFLDGPQTFHKDRAVTGGPLRLGGQTYTKGLGVRSRTKVTYELGSFDRFESTVGVDESAGAAASVRFLVEVDGELAFDSDEMVVSTQPKNVDLSIKGAKQLSLIVDFESRGDAQDYADWANARLVR